MLHHIVLMEPDSDAGLRRIEAAMPILVALCDALPGATGFTHGPNRDFERKSARYAYGFSVIFSDRAAHLAYEAHPEHLRAGGMLVAACRGGHEGIFVADLEV
ncbi:Dabb family protein [Roseicyclus mahoneyensis]|uniref:Stress responsive alpha/beta barrel protein n=1 Tax=Roseicyclus mahoneyensis TaxID=164332 RepID=A0A316GP28_9RHOB|nr:Dabb family protein [Roseicyclus mahoneyensis]PWK61700.1 stress responsive alpha/beta barrel protein [Roseicyclus mahoneyensis]